MQADYIVELAAFKLAPGVSEQTLNQASDRLEQEFLTGLPGYRGRILTQGEANGWLDIVFWDSHASAQAAMAKVADSQACAAYFGCMQMNEAESPDAGVQFFTQQKSYGINI